MRVFKNYLFIILLGAFFLNCNGDYRERAQGNIRDFIVVMDSTQWESATANAIRDTYGKLIFTLPTPEPNYNLIFTPIRSRSQLDRIRKSRNIIFASPIDDDTNVGRQIRAFLDVRMF